MSSKSSKTEAPEAPTRRDDLPETHIAIMSAGGRRYTQAVAAELDRALDRAIRAARDASALRDRPRERVVDDELAQS